ncbi:MAG: hypothetical protein O3A01_05940 [bacterium]|nr:hypothetical protein [bacterium]
MKFYDFFHIVNSQYGVRAANKRLAGLYEELSRIDADIATLDRLNAAFRSFDDLVIGTQQYLAPLANIDSKVEERLV